MGGFQYENDVLQYFPTAEGYVNNTPVNGANSYNYVFNYTDHLGINTGRGSENNSMGGDYRNTKADNRTYNNVYFPKTSRLYKITLEGTQYIKQINSSKDF